jgi:hypothetical protein
LYLPFIFLNVILDFCDHERYKMRQSKNLIIFYRWFNEFFQKLTTEIWHVHYHYRQKVFYWFVCIWRSDELYKNVFEFFRFWNFVSFSKNSNGFELIAWKNLKICLPDVAKRLFSTKALLGLSSIQWKPLPEPFPLCWKFHLKNYFLNYQVPW